MNAIIDDARRAARTGALILGVGVGVAGLLVAAGLSWVAGRYSRATSAPSAQPSTRAERETRKAIRRSFIAAGLGEHDLKALRDEVKQASADVARLRSWIVDGDRRLAEIMRDPSRLARYQECVGPRWRTKHRETRIMRELIAARRKARRSQLRYAVACAAAGAVPRGAR